MLANAKGFTEGRSLALFRVGAFAQSLRGLFGRRAIADIIIHTIFGLLEEATRRDAETNCLDNLAGDTGLVHFDGANVIWAVEGNDIAKAAIAWVATGIR